MEFSNPELHGRALFEILGKLRSIDKQLSASHSINVERYLSQLFNIPRYSNPRRLLKYGWKGLSQFDEDGILQEIFKRIGVKTKTAIEIGAGSGNENNTLYLLNSGWRCLWVESDASRAGALRKKFYGLKNLCVKNLAALPDNVNEISIPGVDELDLWTLDIDGNDYWVFEQFDPAVSRPRVIVLEYNAKYRPPIEWAMPFNPNHKFDKSDYMGASLQSLTRLCNKKGYSLVGCGVTGANAYFVRNDLLENHFLAPFSPENHYEPGRYWLSRGYYVGMDPGQLGLNALVEKNIEV